jgi:dTDP-glucose 4,6-dehydratase
MVVNALDGKPLPVYGDGSNIRDWLYVEDHVRGIDLVIKQGTTGETYNIGGNEEHANLDIVKTLCTSIDDVFAASPGLAKRFPNSPAAEGNTTASLITMVKDRPGHDWRYAIDASRIKNELDFTPAFDFASGLISTVTWMLENEVWWRAVLDDSYRSWIENQYD